MDGQIMRPFVMVIAFVALAASVITGIGRLGQSGEITDSDEIFDDMMPFKFISNHFLNASTTDERNATWLSWEGYNVSSDDILDEVPYPTHDDPFTWWDEDDEDVKYVHIIRDSVTYEAGSTDIWRMYSDFICVRRESQSPIDFLADPTGIFGIKGWDNGIIPFTKIINNFDNETNISQVEFTISGQSDTILIRTDGTDITEALYADDYQIFYGWSLFRMTESDYWDAIGMLLYADIPGVNDYVDAMIHIFVAAVCIIVMFLMAITIADAVIPFT